MPDDLAAFLLARIAEDEKAAREAEPGWWLGDGFEADPDMTHQFNRWDPARVLAECEAKRRIVGEHEGPYLCDTCTDGTDYEEGPDGEPHGYAAMKDWPCPTLRLLALPYADHPDYDASWRP